MTEQARHVLGLVISLLALVLFIVLGTGVVLGGLLMGIGVFTALLLIALKQPKFLLWCKHHPTTTEVGSSLGTFALFSVVGGGTVTAGVAGAVVCLLCSAVLGFSHMGFMKRWIEDTGDGIEYLKDRGKGYFGEETAPKPAHKVFGRSNRVDEAIARAYASSLDTEG